MEAIGAEWCNPEIRNVARRMLWGMRIGILDQWELRFGKPPYTVVATRHDPAALRQSIGTMLATPRLCNPLVCQREILRHDGDIEAMVLHTTRRFTTMLEHSPPTIHDCEREHGQMRQDVHSGGKARNFTCSANRTFNRLAHTEHVRRGGDDVLRRGSGLAMRTALELAGGPGNSAADRLQARAPSRPAGVFVEYRIKREEAFRRLIGAQGRRLTETERTRLEELIQAGWAASLHHPEQRARYVASAREKFHDRCAAARREQAGAAVQHEDGAQRPPWAPIWQASDDPRFLVHPSAIVDEYETMGGNLKALDKIALGDPALQVNAAPAAPRVRGGWGKTIVGCSARMQCRHHDAIPGEDLHRMNRLSDLLTAWTASLGKSECYKMEHWVWLDAEWHAEEPRPHPPKPDLLLLFVDERRGSCERMQYFAVGFIDVALPRYFNTLPDFPFVFKTCIEQVGVLIVRGIARILPQHTHPTSFSVTPAHPELGISPQ